MENKEKKQIVQVGECPICKKGKLVEGTYGYMCNYFKTIDDKCSFTIYKSYFGKELNEDIIKDIIEKGETAVFDDLKSKDGNIFSASLIIEDEKVKPSFQNKKLNSVCPYCGGYIEDFGKGFACENFNKKNEEEERECYFYIPKTICKHKLSENEIQSLIEESYTEFIHDFINNNNQIFSAKLELNENGQIKFSNIIGKCPKCKDGNIYISNRAYSCSNYKNENIKCDFVIWREISGRDISISEAIQLCEDKTTNILKFKNKKGEYYERKLSLNDDFKVIII